MWDTKARIPFEPSLLTERSTPVERARLLSLIVERPGIAVEELHWMRIPGLFAALRSLHRASLIRTDPAQPRFFERATRIYPAA